MTARVGWRAVATLAAALAFAAGTAADAHAQANFSLTLHLSGTTTGRIAISGGSGGLCDYTGAPPNQCVFQIPSGAAIRLSANAPAGQQPGLFSGGTGPAAGCGF